MKSISIKAKVILIIAVCLTLGAVALIGFVNKSYKENVKLVAQQSLDSARKSYRSLEENDYRALVMTGLSIMQDNQMRELYLKRDREALYQYAKPLYDQLSEESGVNLFSFVDTDKNMFLRVKQPEKFNDPINMKVLDTSISTEAIAAGSELGKAGYALRCIIPYRDKSGKIFGYLLIGDTYDNFLTLMKGQTGDDYVMVGSKALVDEEKYHKGQVQKKLPDMWDEFKSVIVFNSTAPYSNKASFDSEIKNIPAEGKLLGELSKDGKVYVRGVFPLVDMANKQLGGVFVTHDITQLYQGMKKVQTSAVAAILILMLVISLTIISTLNSLVFVRLQKTMDVATRVVGGEFNAQIVPASDDEVGKLESLLEQFRVVFVNVVDDLEKSQKKSA